MSAGGVAARPEFEREPISAAGIGDVERPLSPLARLLGQAWLRRAVILVVLAACWEIYARILDNSLLLPSFTETLAALWQDTLNLTLPARVATSLEPLLIGYAVGLALAGLLTAAAVGTRIGAELLATLTAMFNPLPAVALLPLALIWFGLGVPSLVFVIAHSVLWPVALNTLAGFRGVPDVLRMSGRNYGLRGLRYVALLLVPAAAPAILTGLKIGWAFSWRTLIAAELVFGVSSRSGGLGWYIYEARAELDTARVFAGLLTVIVIGLVVESIGFRWIERRTVQRWGMQR